MSQSPEGSTTWNIVFSVKKIKKNRLSRPKAQTTWNKISLLNATELMERLSRPKAQTTWNL